MRLGVASNGYRREDGYWIERERCMNELIYPKYYRVSSGKGTSKYKLVAFDNALIDAGISNYNLLKVSSILPIGCKQRDKIDLREGSPVMTAYATISSSIPGEKIATAVAVGIPNDPDKIGLIMEYEEIGSAEHAEAVVRDMVKESMKSHGINCSRIISSSIDGIVENESFLSLVSAIILW